MMSLDCSLERGVFLMQGRVGRGPVAVMMRGGLVFMSAGGEVNCKNCEK